MLLRVGEESAYSAAGLRTSRRELANRYFSLFWLGVSSKSIDIASLLVE